MSHRVDLMWWCRCFSFILDINKVSLQISKIAFMYLLFGIFLDFIWFLWFIPSLASLTIHIIGSKLNLFAPIYKLVNWFTYGLINSDFVMFLLRFLTLWVPFPFTNRYLARKKSILAKVGFDAKRGTLYMQAKWIYILLSRHLHHFSGYL